MLDFLGIGAQKAGTTWLYHQLCRHPEVSFPGGKEIHYWDLQADPDGSSWLALFGDQQDIRRKGEITPAYAILPPERVAQIQRIAPEARLFYSLRNPVDRTWAQVRMHFVRHQQPLDDLEEVIRFTNSERCIARNDYRGAIERWRSIWGAEALHLILFDDLIDNPRKVLLDLARHIGIGPTHFEQLPEMDLSAKVNAGIERAMPEKLRATLISAYRSEIENLSDIIGRDLGHWIKD